MNTVQLSRNDRNLLQHLAKNVGRVADALDAPDDGCPNCGKPPVGSLVVTLETRGSGREIEAAVCQSCGTVYADDQNL